MIQLNLDENNPRVLRISASYLLALAGDIGVQITGADRPVNVTTTTHTIGDRPVNETAATFNKAELAEQDALTPATPATGPDAASVFGGKSAPSIVDAEASPTAPVDTTATTSIPTPPGAPVPNVPTPPSAAAPVAPPTASPAAGVEVDARGLPWDARIHSGGKTKLKSGNWVNKRGVDESVIKMIEAELAQVMAIPASSSPAPSASVPVPPATPTTPIPPAPTVATASPSSEAEEPFPALMKLIVTATTQGKLTQAQVNTIINAQGFQALPLVGSRPDLVPSIHAAIVGQIIANGHTL